jgi:hypothetical protein
MDREMSTFLLVRLDSDELWVRFYDAPADTTNKELDAKLPSDFRGFLPQPFLLTVTLHPMCICGMYKW